MPEIRSLVSLGVIVVVLAAAIGLSLRTPVESEPGSAQLSSVSRT